MGARVRRQDRHHAAVSLDCVVQRAAFKIRPDELGLAHDPLLHRHYSLEGHEQGGTSSRFGAASVARRVYADPQYQRARSVGSIRVAADANKAKEAMGERKEGQPSRWSNAGEKKSKSNYRPRGGL